MYKTACLLFSLLLVLSVCTISYSQNPDNSSQITVSPTHFHYWEDIRVKPILLTEKGDSTVKWKYEDREKIQIGYWILSRRMQEQSDGIRHKRFQIGKRYLGMYCSKCNLVLWLYNFE